MSAFERMMMMSFEGSVDTATDLARWVTGNLPPVSAGTAAEASNLRSSPGWQDIVDQFAANGYKTARRCERQGCAYLLELSVRAGSHDAKDAKRNGTTRRLVRCVHPSDREWPVCCACV